MANANQSTFILTDSQVSQKTSPFNRPRLYTDIEPVTAWFSVEIVLLKGETSKVSKPGIFATENLEALSFHSKELPQPNGRSFPK